MYCCLFLTTFLTSLVITVFLCYLFFNGTLNMNPILPSFLPSLPSLLSSVENVQNEGFKTCHEDLSSKKIHCFYRSALEYHQERQNFAKHSESSPITAQFGNHLQIYEKHSNTEDYQELISAYKKLLKENAEKSKKIKLLQK